jgi:hypothetical protein
MASMATALFVGNSYTFYEDMPAQVAALAREAGRPVEVEVIAEGGASFREHVEALGALERIARSGLDHVVLQDQSGGPLHDRARFEAYGTRLADAVRGAGARLVWYQTWARAEGHDAYRAPWSGGSPSEMTRRVRAAYEGMRARFGGVIAPVGEAFERARRERAEVSLYDADLHHASAEGSHLAALVIFAVLTGESPRDATFRPKGVGEARAAVLRRIAAETVAREPLGGEPRA